MRQEDGDDLYSDEEAERRAREAIRRSFQIPYKPRKELEVKTERARAQKARRAKTPPKTR